MTHYVVRLTRTVAALADPTVHRHRLVYALNPTDALRRASKGRLAGESLAVVGRCYF